MNEQEQAQELARWLEQPAGTPPPEGVDPDVIESIYAMRPDLAPGPRLTIDDILGDFDLGSVAPPVQERSEPVRTAAAMPPTPVTAAPSGWRSANRVAGLGVLLATAATLLLIALPVMESQSPAPQSEVAAAPEVAAARQSADPIASTADEWAAPAGSAAATPPAQAVAKDTPIPVEDLTLRVQGDAVADAGSTDDVLDFKTEQNAHYGGVDKGLIPEAEAALLERNEDPKDAVAVVDEPEEALDQTRSAAQAEAEPVAAQPSAGGSYGYDNDRDEEQVIQPKREQRRASKKAAENDLSDVSSAPAAAAPIEIPSNRSRATVRDLGSEWRDSVDAGTLADIDTALSRARAEAGLGEYGKAGDLLAPLVTAPVDKGQYVAGVAADYYLRAGNLRAASDVIQRGLGLGSENTPYRAQLVYLYGLQKLSEGDLPAAEAQWEDAAELNDLR